MHFQSFGILPSPSLLMRQGRSAADFVAIDAVGFPSVIETALAVFCRATSLLRTCVKADPAQLCWNVAVQLVTILAQSAQGLPRQIRLVPQIKRYKRSFSLRNLGKSAKY